MIILQWKCFWLLCNQWHKLCHSEPSSIGWPDPITILPLAWHQNRQNRPIYTGVVFFSITLRICTTSPTLNPALSRAAVTILILTHAFAWANRPSPKSTMKNQWYKARTNLECKRFIGIRSSRVEGLRSHYERGKFQSQPLNQPSFMMVRVSCPHKI